MDLSGFGQALVSCCYVAVIPPIPAGLVLLIIYIISKVQGKNLDRDRAKLIFLIIYGICIVGTCLYSWFFIMADMYVM